jgi:hypothetical protein
MSWMPGPCPLFLLQDANYGSYASNHPVGVSRSPSYIGNLSSPAFCFYADTTNMGTQISAPSVFYVNDSFSTSGTDQTHFTALFNFPTAAPTAQNYGCVQHNTAVGAATNLEIRLLIGGAKYAIPLYQPGANTN